MSASTTPTLCPVATSAAATLTVTDDLPTPPLPLATAYTRVSAVGGDIDILDHAELGDGPPGLGVEDVVERRDNLLCAGRSRSHRLDFIKPICPNEPWSGPVRKRASGRDRTFTVAAALGRVRV